MKKFCLFRRRAVSTMIGGIIVLTLLLTALGTMVFVSQQYDAYQSLVSKMSQTDINRFAENLVAVYPGLVGPTNDSGTNRYTMILNNVGGIGTQIARLYINSTNSGCTSVCILDPAPSRTVYRFRQGDAFINPGEPAHNVTFWLPSTTTLPTDLGSNTVWIITTRGRIFSFQWTLPPTGGTTVAGGPGSLYIGPLVIKFEPILITYTTNTVSIPAIPISSGWLIPSHVNIIFFIKFANKGVNDVKLSKASNFQVQQFGSPGNVVNFWMIAPMSTNLCQNTFQRNPLTANVTCASSYSGGNTYPNGNNLVVYDGTKHPYIIPKNPTQPGVCCGPPVYVLFAAQDMAGKPNQNKYSQIPEGYDGPLYTFLDLTFIYDDGTGSYVYGVNLPFISFCAGDTLNNCRP